MSGTRISNLLGKITILLIICFFALSAQAKYGGGTGGPNDPYLIYDANQMNAIGADSNDWDKHFKLMADIDLGAFTETSFNIIGIFTGTFDGNSHTISNFTYTSTTADYLGLFGYVYDPNAEIKDLGLIDPNLDTRRGRNIGSLVGSMRDGTVTNCYVEGGSVSGYENVGGLVGVNAGTITNCYSAVSVSGGHDIGGLVGRNGGTITNCYAAGSVSGAFPVGGLVGKNYGTISNCSSSASVSGDWDVGGMVGENYGTISNCYSNSHVSGSHGIGGLVGSNDGTISNCYSSGDISGGFPVGGLVGVNGWFGTGTITNCYSTGSVSGGGHVGGLVGLNHYGTITNSYSSGYVSGSHGLGVGGLVGHNHSGTITNAFWDMEASGQSTSAGGTGKTTAQMQTMSTFTDAGWDFVLVWGIREGIDYPRLLWEPELTFSGGTGISDDPYLISTTNDLSRIGHNTRLMGAHFKLINDIDLTGTDFLLIGSELFPFRGVFDGNGYTIANFNYTSTDTDYIGIFGYVTGEIKEVGLIDPNVDAGTGSFVGALVGLLIDGTVTNCYVKGSSVVGNEQVAGLVGDNSGKITDSYSTGSVAGESQVGGLVGSNRGTIIGCCSIGDISGERLVGGLVGENFFGTINNCYAAASVWGDVFAGGLAGGNHEGTISNCYSTGSVSGDDNVGGLVGRKWWHGRVWASFWDIDTSGQTTSAAGTGLPTDEMQMQSTFTDVGWDFVGETFNGIDNIWFIPQQDYPHLWWEGMEVSMKLTPRTLNCRSKGNWVKAHLTLPEGFTVADVDSNRPAVLHSFGFESDPLYVFVNENELVEIEAAFEREAVCSLAGHWPETLTVAGFLTDGNIFLGTSTVRMITPGLKDIEELALYWLNADCVKPDFCNEIDMNRDSLVNLLDYALLLNSQVEFVSE